MTTQNPQLVKLPVSTPRLGAVRGYAGGGFIDRLLGASKPETVTEKFARQDAEFKAKHPERFQAEQPTTQATQAQPATGLGGIRGMVGGSIGNNLKEREKAAGLKNGGMIKGPGTATSDSIPAVVRQTGEPLEVSTDERIVSKAQNGVLEKIAKERGFKSVDAMFEAETGKPVGPTVEYKESPKMECGGMLRKLAMGGEVNMPMNTDPMTAQDQQAFGNSQNTATGVAPATPVATAPTATTTTQTATPPKQLKSSTLAALNSYTPLPMPQLKNGGMVRRLAAGGLVDPLDKRIAQIPTGGSTAPAPDGSSQQSDFMRNATNTANALPGVGGALSGGAALASTVPAVVRGLAAAKPLVRKGLGMVKAVAPYAVPAAGFGALQAVSSADTTTTSSTPTPTASTPAAPARKEPNSDLTSGINAAMTNSQTDLATTGMKANDIYKTKQANGTTAYSGYGDGTGKVGGMVRGDGTAVPGRGSVSVMPAMGAGAIKSALTNPDGTAWSAGDNAIMAANLRDGVDPYRGTSRQAKPDPMDQPMTKDQRAARIRMAEIASQDKRYGETNAIAQGNLGMVRTEHAAKMATQKQLADAQAEYLAAGDDPVKLKAAERKLIAMGVKQPTPSRMVVVPGGQEIVDGMTRTVPSRVFDTDIKQYVDPQGGPQGVQPAALPPKDKLVKGQTYPTPRGNAVWDGKAFVPI